MDGNVVFFSVMVFYIDFTSILFSCLYIDIVVMGSVMFGLLIFYVSVHVGCFMGYMSTYFV